MAVAWPATALHFSAFTGSVAVVALTGHVPPALCLGFLLWFTAGLLAYWHLAWTAPDERFEAARWAYPRSPEYRRGVADFHAALAELEDRGLLQWDRAANTYDLHPVVRAYAFDILEEGERTRAFGAIGDHFASRPRENAQEDVFGFLSAHGAIVCIY